MGPLSQSDCRRLLSAIEAVYGIRSVAEFPGGVLSAVRRLLSSNTICFNEMSGDLMTSWVTEPSDALPGPILRQAFLRNAGQHPVLAHGATTGEGTSYRISDFASRQRFHDLPLYSEYYRPMSVEYQLIAAIAIGARQVGVALDRNVADFSDDERLCLELLRPHLTQAYRNAHTMDLLMHAAEGGDKKLLFASRSAPGFTASDDVWRLIEKYFEAPGACGPMPDLLMRWLKCERSRFGQDNDFPPPPFPLVVLRDTGRLALRFVWGGMNADLDGVILEETRTPSIASSTCPALTRRELEVLTLLREGKTNEEIGLALFVSPLTVKKHLEHIYEKMDVHGRAGAVGRFSR